MGGTCVCVWGRGGGVAVKKKKKKRTGHTVSPAVRCPQQSGASAVSPTPLFTKEEGQGVSVGSCV